MRKCDDGGPLPIVEYHVQRIYFDTPNNVNDPNDPCYTIHWAYINSVQNGGYAAKIAFIRDLMTQGIEAVAVSDFNRHYTYDSVDYLINPQSPGGVRYLARKCQNGQQTYRAIQASCMQAFIWDDCDYPETGILSDNGDGKEARAAYDPTYTVQPCRYVRYDICHEEGPCCVEILKICKQDPILYGGNETTVVTKTTEVVGASTSDCTEQPGKLPLPGETTSGCFVYCDNEEPTTIRLSENPDALQKPCCERREKLDAK